MAQARRQGRIRAWGDAGRKDRAERGAKAMGQQTGKAMNNFPPPEPRGTPSAKGDGRVSSEGATARAAGRLSKLDAKIDRGERLNSQERLERQGLIFNHSGKCGKIVTK